MLLAFALIVLVLPAGYAQAPNSHGDRETPHFRVDVWGDVAADFSTRVSSYFELRKELEKGVPALQVTNDPAEIWGAMRALAERIRKARPKAKQGDFFTPPIAATFRKALLLEMDANSWAAVMNDNPGKFAVQIIGSYRGGRPFSTVPPTILAVLPKLPDDIQYRFLGRQLILFDARANVILDRIRHEIPLQGRRQSDY